VPPSPRAIRNLVDLLGGAVQKVNEISARDLPVVAVVGYTNAGKSALLSTRTDAGALAEDKLGALEPIRPATTFPRGLSHAETRQNSNAVSSMISPACPHEVSVRNRTLRQIRTVRRSLRI
jgi:hypothetical protein